MLENVVLHPKLYQRFVSFVIEIAWSLEHSYGVFTTFAWLPESGYGIDPLAGESG